MSDFNIDEYERIPCSVTHECDGCIADNDMFLCDKLIDVCLSGNEPQTLIFKLKDKSKGESDD